MGYVARRQAAEPVETWPGMKAAADSRFWDGLTLAVDGVGREAGAVYLLGYVAEMLLKTAYCQFTGLGPNQPIYPILRAASATIHDLSALSYLLIRTRANAAAPMDARIAGDLVRRVSLIDSHREVTMRYSGFPALPHEVEEVLEGVDWLRKHYDLLWS